MAIRLTLEEESEYYYERGKYQLLPIGSANPFGFYPIDAGAIFGSGCKPCRM
jgi:hypothetical protein